MHVVQRSQSTCRLAVYKSRGGGGVEGSLVVVKEEKEGKNGHSKADMGMKC